jgi:hypothetical protein
MARKQLVAGFALGVLTTLVAVVLLSAGQEMPRAMAQTTETPPVQSSVGRYQISAWAHAGSIGAVGAGSFQPSHGAYVLDTQTGRVWRIVENARPASIGAAQ